MKIWHFNLEMMTFKSMIKDLAQEIYAKKRIIEAAANRDG